MSERQPPYFYFSSNCEHCERLSKYIKQYPQLAHAIKWVPIESRNFPKNLRSVPAIMFQGELYHGTDAFGFIQKQVEMLEQQLAQQAQQSQQNNLQQQPNGSRLNSAQSNSAEAMKRRSQPGQPGQPGQQQEPLIDGFCFGEECGVELSSMGDEMFNGSNDKNVVSRPGEFSTLSEVENVYPQQQQQQQESRKNKEDPDAIKKIQEMRNREMNGGRR
jgi:hypothetical protein